MTKLILYHGTSQKRAMQIKRAGFVSGIKHNWDVHSKKGFVYLSTAYAPFYAMMNTGTNKLALIQVEANTNDCYPEDDFLMYAMGKKTYTQKEMDSIDLELYKKYWNKSLEYIGNVAVKPDKIKILGIRKFSGKNLICKCDPVINPMNFMIMGDYYKGLTEWIYAGKNILEYEANLIERSKNGNHRL